MGLKDRFIDPSGTESVRLCIVIGVTDSSLLRNQSLVFVYIVALTLCTYFLSVHDHVHLHNS